MIYHSCPRKMMSIYDIFLKESLEVRKKRTKYGSQEVPISYTLTSLQTGELVTRSIGTNKTNILNELLILGQNLQFFLGITYFFLNFRMGCYFYCGRKILKSLYVVEYTDLFLFISFYCTKALCKNNHLFLLCWGQSASKEECLHTTGILRKLQFL